MIPAINGRCLSYRHPLSAFQPAKEIAEEGIAYLSKLNLEILAGIWLTIYRHYELVAPCKMSAIEQNKLLQSAGYEQLIQAIRVGLQITHDNKDLLPAFSLDWATHKDAASLTSSLYSFTRTVRDIVAPPAYVPSNQDTIQVSSIKLTKGELKRTKAGKLTLSDVEREFEAEFQAGKRKAKDLLNSSEVVSLIDAPFLAFLKQLIAGRNLIAINEGLRGKIYDRLSQIGNTQIDILAEIIKASHNPYDIFASVDDALERASDSFTGATRPKKTLAEILADKREKQAREARLAAGEDNTDDEDFEQDSEEAYIDPLEDF
jgi:hypothetical protein